MADPTPLSPATQAVMIAATNGNTNVVNDPVYKQCIAAALRAAADQIEPDDGVSTEVRQVLNKLLAIANELENHQ